MSWTQTSLDLDVDVRAHVFELTIRSLGGLLSAHSLLIRDPALMPGVSCPIWPVTVRCCGAAGPVQLTTCIPARCTHVCRLPRRAAGEGG